MPSFDSHALARQQRRNRCDSAIILLALGLWLASVGFLVLGPDGVVWGFVATAIVLLFQPLRTVTVMRAIFGALPLTAAVAPELVAMVAELARRAGLARAPGLWYLPQMRPLAFSTSSGGEAAIALSDGLLTLLPVHELATVLAHEICHIRVGDVTILRLADAARSQTRFLSLFGLLLLLFYLPEAWSAGIGVTLPLVLGLAPLACDLMTLKLARTREFAADAGAAELTGDPLALIDALRHLESASSGGWEQLFWRRAPSLIRSHPTTEERAARLAELAPARHRSWRILPEALLPPILPAPHRGGWWMWWPP